MCKEKCFVKEIHGGDTNQQVFKPAANEGKVAMNYINYKIFGSLFVEKINTV